MERTDSTYAAAATLGCYDIACLDFEVADISGADPFLSACGLAVRLESGVVSAFAGGSDHGCLRIVAGRRKRLARIAFAAFPQDIAPLRARAIAAGHHPIEDDAGRIVLRGPDGVEVEIVGRERARRMAAVPPVAGRPASRSRTPSPDPLRLSHVAIFTSDVDRALDFYTRILGLGLSDRSGDALAFLHAPHGSDHHVLGLVKSHGPGVHHYSFDMGTIDAIGLRAKLAAGQGYHEGWGFGRHVLGSNYFHYIRDPWGSHAELTAGLDQIAVNSGWQARDHAAEDAFYLWGPPPPAGFIDNPERAGIPGHDAIAA